MGGATQLYACMWKCQKSTYMGGSNDFCGHEVQTQSGTVRDLCNDFGEAKKAQGLCKKQSPKCNSAWVCASQQGNLNPKPKPETLIPNPKPKPETRNLNPKP